MRPFLSARGELALTQRVSPHSAQIAMATGQPSCAWVAANVQFPHTFGPVIGGVLGVIPERWRQVGRDRVGCDGEPAQQRPADEQGTTSASVRLASGVGPEQESRHGEGADRDAHPCLVRAERTRREARGDRDQRALATK